MATNRSGHRPGGGIASNKVVHRPHGKTELVPYAKRPAGAGQIGLVSLLDRQLSPMDKPNSPERAGDRMWSDARRQIVGRLPRGWHLRSVCEVRGGNQRRPDRLGPVLNRRRSNGHVGPLIAMTSARERLPNRRSSETFSFELSGLHFHRYRLAL